MTPFLLDAIVKQTGGASLATNIALVKSGHVGTLRPRLCGDALCPPYGALAAEIAAAMGGGEV